MSGLMRALGATFVALALTSAACRNGVPLGGFEDPADAAAPPLVSEAGAITPDANAFRPLCAGTECPVPYGTCSDDAFRCETNFDSDNTSCGACGVTCPSGPALRDLFGAEFHCQSGACRMVCSADTAKHTGDCNHDVADGCEVDLDCDANNCGACGVKCPSGLGCVQGNCGCPAGLAACGANTCGAECLDLQSDDFNCGTCGRECPTSDPPPAPNTHLGCTAGACGGAKCDPGFGNCNGSAADGCETELSVDPNNCNTCGHACAAGQACEDGKCRCAPTETRCQGFGSFTYCADLANDVQDCGVCGNPCPSTDYPTRSICRLGRCELQCPSGQADCDGDASNGCETLVSSDPRNCGGCGVPCDLAIGQPCVGGSCLLTPCDEGPAR